MTSVKFQDTKSIYRNQLHFYTQIISSQKKEIKKMFHWKLHQKLKYLGINLNNNVKELYIWKCTGPRINKTILKKNIIGGLLVLDPKTNYKTIVTTCASGIKARYINQWNRIESPKINPYRHMVKWFSTKVNHSTNGAKNEWVCTCKRMNLDPSLTPYAKINSKQTKSLNV